MQLSAWWFPGGTTTFISRPPCGECVSQTCCYLVWNIRTQAWLDGASVFSLSWRLNIDPRSPHSHPHYQIFNSVHSRPCTTSLAGDGELGASSALWDLFSERRLPAEDYDCNPTGTVQLDPRRQTDRKRETFTSRRFLVAAWIWWLLSGDGCRWVSAGPGGSVLLLGSRL